MAFLSLFLICKVFSLFIFSCVNIICNLQLILTYLLCSLLELAGFMFKFCEIANYITLLEDFFLDFLI